MNPEDLRRWVDEKRVAEVRERAELRRAPPDPAWAIRSALALIAFGDRFGPRPSAADEREAARIRAAWARLRAHYGTP